MLRALAIVLVLASTAAAGEPTEVIKQANDKFRASIKAKRDIDLRDMFDMDGMGQLALVDHWDKMTPAQRAEYTTTLTKLVQRSYTDTLSSNAAYTVVYLGEEVKGDDMVVKTMIKSERRGRSHDIQVDYSMHKLRGTWRVYDVATDDTPMVRTYRNDFNKVIAKDGIDGLIVKMKNKL